ncbi:HlyD family secretion protein [Flagellimonas allohymeniacidonis]|uniref:HlyD family efflux transporter periplasmic adaptor subunit n=1 Tax=Flagellimonas allohymeniacidonis TaxID=2517819 RepID=A0A4Q8QI13_9FLAO|nr:HlyD family efflux transporter periplasmic adaptor subunit [Allomuricauda hymeniacidonis]TAI48089.1 HlyD family efflux transporter periplasmic adaptor subunit [Allomuricauda hymeniacidonis]
MPEKESKDNLYIRSEEVQEILTNPPSWIVRWGITLIFLFTFIVLVLSFIIKYPDFVSAKIIVTTERPAEQLKARQSGAIDTIFIENRQSVKPNQRLAILKNTANYKDVYFLKSIIDTLDFTLNDFSFPIELIVDLNLGDIEIAYIDFEKSYVEYYLLKDLEPYVYKLESNAQSLAEIKTQLISQIKQKQLLEREQKLAKVDFERHKQLFERGVISQQEYESKELEFIQMQKQISTMAISISQMRGAISSANEALKSTQLNEREESTRFLRNLAQSYNALQKSIRDWEHAFVLSSSIDGIVSFQEYWGVNQNVTIGDVVFSVLPKNTSNLVGKSTIASQNSGKVTVGQKVLIKLDNYPYQQFGMLVGFVENISISPNADEQYFVYISLPNGTKTSYGQKLVFDQELLGNAEIITEDLSVAERLFYKFKEVFKYR